MLNLFVKTSTRVQQPRKLQLANDIDVIQSMRDYRRILFHCISKINSYLYIIANRYLYTD